MGSLMKTVASMGDYCAVLATVLAPGDLIIGADDSKYLIDSIDVTSNEHGFIIYAVSEAGDSVKTEIPRNAAVNRITHGALREGDFGSKVCVSCDTLRPGRYWTADDYMCKVCRNELEEA